MNDVAPHVDMRHTAPRRGRYRWRICAMLVCALYVVPIVFASRADHPWLAVALIGLATAGHQGWSANVFALTSDMFPRRAVASVGGLAGAIGAIGAIGGMMIATFIRFPAGSDGQPCVVVADGRFGLPARAGRGGCAGTAPRARTA